MLFKQAARLETEKEVKVLWRGVVKTLATAGFDHAIYLTVNANFQKPLLLSTMTGLYDAAAVEDDPFLRYACNSYKIIPIGTEFVDGHPYITQQERAFIDRAGTTGFTSGLGIPMRLQGSERFGGFIVGTGLDRATFMERIFPRAEEIRLFCLLIHRRIEELTVVLPSQANLAQANLDFREPLIAPELPVKLNGLSPREREIIYLLAQGSSRQETSEICGISIHTVSDYAKSGYRKLGVRNRAQAAAIIFATTT